MQYETLETRLEGATLVVTINRPKVLNALNPQVIEDLDKVIEEAMSRDEVSGLILTGAGEKAFVAGADIAQINKIPADESAAYSARGQAVFAKYENSPKPTIAAINGFALGGGCELAMACHIRIASASARFGQPEVKLGLIAGYGGTQRLPRLIGRGKATELLLTGAMIKAPEALQLGLVNQVVEPGELLKTCLEMLETIYKNSPLAVANTLAAIEAGIANPLTGYEKEAELFGASVSSDDGREGTLAFIEKRTANFTGK